jgi:hypothetical protein
MLDAPLAEVTWTLRRLALAAGEAKRRSARIDEVNDHAVGGDLPMGDNEKPRPRDQSPE